MKLILALITIVISFGSIAQDTVSYDQFLLNPYMIEWSPRETPDTNNLDFKSPSEYLCSKRTLLCPKIEERSNFFKDYLPEKDTCTLRDEIQVWDNNYIYLKNEKFLRDFEAITIHPASVSDGGLFLPSSLRFYLENGKVNEDWDMHYQSFYAKKFEVTNKEYREFIIYVRDSLARTLLAKKYPHRYYMDSSKTHLNWDEPLYYFQVPEKEGLSQTDYHNTIKQLFLPFAERYYNTIEFDPRKLIYKAMDGDVINVYPDTLSWVHDYVAPIMEPLTNMYNWHPAYADAPVVGVSKQQAEAYLEWKTKDIKKMFAKLGYEISLSLPSPAEWEIMNVYQYNDHYTPGGEGIMHYLYNQNNTQNLILNFDSTSLYTSIFNTDILGRAISTYPKLPTPEIIGYKTGRRNKEKFISMMNPYGQIHTIPEIDGRTVYMLGKNVSEWIDFERNGKAMVAGGSWLHNYPLIDNFINQGAYLHTFVSPKEQHASLGFRYVIRVKNPNQNSNNRIISEKAINAFYMQQICSEWRLPVKELSRFFKSDTLHLTKKIPGDKSFRFQLNGSLTIHQPIQLYETKTKISEGDLGSFGVIDGVMLISNADKPYAAKYEINLDHGIIQFSIQNHIFRYKIIKLNFIDFILVRI